jgi:sulfur-oxidizing protein SoxB
VLKREFLHLLGAASAAGLALPARGQGDTGRVSYEVPVFGNVHMMHFTDSHAQLLPVYFREPHVNLGVGQAFGKPPHLVGDAFLRHYGIAKDSAQAYAFTHLGFESAARSLGKVGGFAHLATLVQQLRAARPQALLLDGGDTWQGSATALWTRGQDMVDASKLLGVNMMTAHWEFTHGAQRVKEILANDLKGSIEFLAQNVKTTDFEDPVFSAYSLRTVNGQPVAFIGQAFPYTPIANPRWMVPEWSFGIQDDRMQSVVDEVRAKGAWAVVVLSHNGMDVDLKMASRVRGIDAILGGHTHDGVPAPVVVTNPGGKTLVTNAGSNGKFLALLELEVGASGVKDYRYRLLPVFSGMLKADPQMQAFINKVRAPYQARLGEALAHTDAVLYRRGNFNGSFDQLILDALMEVKGAEIAFSPGFRWGTSLLPGEAITREHLMDQTAITYPQVSVNQFSGAMIKTVLEDVADNLFNPDPYYQQGGDMVRVGGLHYTIDPLSRAGARITDMRLRGQPLEADRNYTVAGWAPVAEGAKGEPIWEVVETWLKAKKRVAPQQLNLPRVLGMNNNPGMES